MHLNAHEFDGQMPGHFVPMLQGLIGPYMIALLALIITPILGVGFGGEKVDVISFWITLLLIHITGVSLSVATSKLLGFAAIFPSEYVGAVMSGMGVSATVVAVVKVVTKAAFPDSAQGT